MDIQSIDREYDALQTQSQQTIQALQTLGGKLQTASQSGNQDAREWLLDLRELALSFQSEQNRMNNLLQALHGLIASQQQSAPVYQQPAPQPSSVWNAAPAPQQPAYEPQPAQGGFGGFLNSSLGRGLAMGAGFGIADDLIKDIF
jgi:hypothetical protein